MPFSLPNDAPRLAALALVLLVIAGGGALSSRRVARVVVTLAPAAAAALSAAYVVVYLRGGPRIIDATAYWLEAKALSLGMLGIPLPLDEHAVLGRFLLRGADDASVIFPPGYPAVLALGFVIGAPLAVGPALAAALVFATMSLTRRVARALALDSVPQRVALAALLSTFCAALRYHTADTMSHGLTALCVTVALDAALALRKQPRRAWLVGLALGWCFATRPVTAMALGLALASMAPPSSRARAAALGRALIAALPGLALWFVYQHHATGHGLSTAQDAYYALSDGPPGCFRYGFGEAIGCLGEHGDFVRHNLPHGYGALEAIGTSARRLQLHVSDALGFAPLFALVLVGAWRVRTVARGLGVMLVAQLLAYAPFYFDGNYPGGGARIFADLLPLEHVLAVVGVSALARRVTWRVAADATVALGLAGFAFHLGNHHAQLRDREGGRPMFEAARVNDGLVFVDTDHGFNLALAWALGRPERRAARYKGDGHDALVWERDGGDAAPRDRQAQCYLQAQRYHHDFSGGAPWVEPFTPPADDAIAAASLWPPRAVSHAWAWPSYLAHPCTTRARVLDLRPVGGRGSMVVALPRWPRPGELRVRVAAHHQPVEVVVQLTADGETNRSESRHLEPRSCAVFGPFSLSASGPRAEISIDADREVAIDVLELRENR